MRTVQHFARDLTVRAGFYDLGDAPADAIRKLLRDAIPATTAAALLPDPQKTRQDVLNALEVMKKMGMSVGLLQGRIFEQLLTSDGVVGPATYPGRLGR